jgi:hypothetical protein
MVLKELEWQGADWIILAEDKDHGQARGYMVKSLQIS